MATGKCPHAASHRKAQAKHVAKIGAKAQAARVKRSEAKHKTKVADRKAKARKDSGGKTGTKTGRPREC